MKILSTGLFAGMLLAGTAAMAEPPLSPAQLQQQQQREAYLAYSVAAASVDGDLVGDHIMAGLLRVHLAAAHSGMDTVPPQTDRERTLRAEAEVLQVRLSARADAAAMDHPELLAANLGCWPVGATPELCDQRRRRLAALAGDNAYYRVVLMATAWQLGDADAFLENARAGASAAHYRGPYGDYYDRLHTRYRQVPARIADRLPTDPQGLPAAGVAAMAMSAGFASPPYQHFSQPCREAEGELREYCLAIALMQLEAQGSAIDTLLAAGVVEALGDTAERDLARSRARSVKWQMAQMGQLGQRELAGTKTSGHDRYFAQYGTKGEWAATRDLLAANGLPVDPPEDWMP